MLTSYHNHTNWSDGACTLDEQIAGARAAGLDELGISDHYTLHPSGAAIEWSMDLDKLGGYVAVLQEAASREEGPVIRVGIEADFFPETVGALRDRLAQYPFDYVIGSVHFVDGFPVDEGAHLWDPLTEAERNAMWRRYWALVKEMAESRVFDFAAHIDLCKRFGHRPTDDLSAEIGAALDALAAADMAVEINTAGWSLPVKEAYPSPEILRAARERNIPLLINADAHSPKHLTRNFERARELARAAGYSEVVRYEQRRRIAIPL